MKSHYKIIILLATMNSVFCYEFTPEPSYFNDKVLTASGSSIVIVGQNVSLNCNYFKNMGFHNDLHWTGCGSGDSSNQTLTFSATSESDDGRILHLNGIINNRSDILKLSYSISSVTAAAQIIELIP